MADEAILRIILQDGGGRGSGPTSPQAPSPSPQPPQGDSTRPYQPAAQPTASSSYQSSAATTAFSIVSAVTGTFAAVSGLRTLLSSAFGPIPGAVLNVVKAVDAARKLQEDLLKEAQKTTEAVRNVSVTLREVSKPAPPVKETKVSPERRETYEPSESKIYEPEEPIKLSYMESAARRSTGPMKSTEERKKRSHRESQAAYRQRQKYKKLLEENLAKGFGPYGETPAEPAIGPTFDPELADIYSDTSGETVDLSQDPAWIEMWGQKMLRYIPRTWRSGGRAMVPYGSAHTPSDRLLTYEPEKAAYNASTGMVGQPPSRGLVSTSSTQGMPIFPMATMGAEGGAATAGLSTAAWIGIGVAAAIAAKLIADAVVSAINERVDRYSKYSAVIGQAQALAEVQTVVGDLRRARQLESGLSGYIGARNELDNKIEDIKVAMLQGILPSVEAVLNTLNLMLGPASDVLSVLNVIANRVNPVSTLIEIYNSIIEATRGRVRSPTDVILNTRGDTPLGQTGPIPLD